MGVNFKLIFILTGLIFILSSCRTSAPRLDYQALARASILLGVDINMEDNHKLYLESAEWIGVPYRGGGDSKRGTDCSGLTYQIYRKVYRTQVPRNTEDLRKESTKVAKRNLREVGYADSKYFMRVFKRRTGLTPGQYRDAFPARLYNTV